MARDVLSDEDEKLYASVLDSIQQQRTARDNGLLDQTVVDKYMTRILFAAIKRARKTGPYRQPVATIPSAFVLTFVGDPDGVMYQFPDSSVVGVLEDGSHEICDPDRSKSVILERVNVQLSTGRLKCLKRIRSRGFSPCRGASPVLRTPYSL